MKTSRLLLTSFFLMMSFLAFSQSVTLLPTAQNPLRIKANGDFGSLASTGAFGDLNFRRNAPVGDGTNGTDVGFIWMNTNDFNVGTWASNTTGNMNLLTQDINRIKIMASGDVAIGNFTPTAKLHVDGDFALKKKILLTGNGGHSNYDRAGASVISIATPANGGGGETISGIADGVDGLIIHIYPVQGTSVTLTHESASSLAANRIITQTAANVTIINNGGVTLMYDSSVSRWRVIGIAN